jgi:hypothetical protein
MRAPMGWDLHETALWSFEGLGWNAVEVGARAEAA